MKKNSFLRLFGFMGKTLPLYILGILGLSAAGFILNLFAGLALRDMYDAIAISDMSMVIKSTRLFGVVVVCAVIWTPIFQYLVDSAAAITTGNIRNRVFKHVQRLPIGYFNHKHSGDLISRLTNDISETEKAYSTTFINLCSKILIGVGTALIMFIHEWRLATLSIIIGLCSLIINSLGARWIKKLSVEVQKNLGNLTEKLSDILVGFKVIRSFNLSRFILGKYSQDNDKVYAFSYRRVGISAILASVNTFCGVFSFVGLFGVGCYLVLQNEITIGVILLVIQLQNGVHELFGTLTSFITELQSSLAASERLFEILEEDIEPVAYQMEKGSKSDEGIIVFDNVGFCYAEGEKIFQNLSFTVDKGRTVALVGSSGGGKSTILKLIQGFYRPNQGVIAIGGKPLNQQTLVEIRSQTAYVPQDAFLFSGTIAENIGYGREDATLEEIIAAARMANAHEFITALEKRYDTLVGERGTHLSGGQRQRIAIARAILKDAPILLLDEATSALDNESEYLVQEALQKLMHGRTTLVIAHRLSTIQNADQILVIKDGMMVEVGTHLQLLQIADGVYQQLYYQQFVENDKGQQIAANG